MDRHRLKPKEADQEDRTHKVTKSGSLNVAKLTAHMPQFNLLEFGKTRTKTLQRRNCHFNPKCKYSVVDLNHA